MKKNIGLFLLIAVFILTPILSGYTAFLQNTPLSNDDVLKMLSGQLGENVIIARIEQGPCKFDLSTEALLALKKAGASDHLIEVIIKAASPNPLTSTVASTPALTEAPAIAVPPFRFKAERTKMHVGSEKAVRGDLYNEGGTVVFKSSKGTVQWPVKDLLATHESSWHATVTEAGSIMENEWDTEESVVSTLSDGQKVFFDWSERTRYAGAPILNVLMMAAAADFLEHGISTYQPSGGRTDDTLSFRVVHVRSTGLMGMGEIHYCTGQLDVSLKTGTVIFKDSQNPKFSFELSPMDVYDVRGDAFISTKVTR